MNALTVCRADAKRPMPWFDEYLKNNIPCKVYHDGGAYVAVPPHTCVKKHPRGASFKCDWDFLFEYLYSEAQQLDVADIKAYVRKGFDEACSDVPGIDEFLTKKFAKLERNLWLRKKRFRRKAYLNEWNYFVTFTYNDELHDEESFKAKLRKCLSNLHTRRGWNYMGVWERSPEEKRLHFHCIMYIPDGQMIGNLYERRDYSTRQHKMVVTHPVDFFETRFGRCDFEKLGKGQLRHSNQLNYILKYLEKTNERIVYSRGIPTEFYLDVNFEHDVAAEFIDYVLKFVLFDDVVDYEFDVLNKSRPLEFYQYETPLPS